MTLKNRIKVDSKKCKRQLIQKENEIKRDEVEKDENSDSKYLGDI